MKIGLISDTHNYLDPRVLKIFAGVDHILHAGDVGQLSLLVELEQIAPVTAVTGNTDEGLPLRETEVVALDGKKFLIHHIVTPGVASPRIAERLRLEKPDVVMFGHTHKPFARQVEGILYFNPGSAGRKRFELPRTVALMEITNGKLSHRTVALE
ncbi:MAG TPA: metallophosphoesterase family protein [Candidatus Limnocylindria bacterium]|nr:metallophosphoesterase family protein [Candidatus Limnocylindria bacterium]